MPVAVSASDGVANTFSDARGELFDRIYADICAFSATEEFKDDIAFVVTRFQ